MATLQPLGPPGSAQRKALAYAPEIQRLRAEGYTVEAILESLAAAGVEVSRSTVQREANRAARLPANTATATHRVGEASATTLYPLRPPGSAQRKALAFASEIQRLRREGYTFEAIREALAAAGVVVSRSTVQSESNRPARLALKTAPVAADKGEKARLNTETFPALPALPASAAARSLLASPEGKPDNPFSSDPRSAQQIAADFMRGINTNPLMQPKKDPS